MLISELITSACIISIVRLAFIEKVGLAYDSSWTDIVPGMISTAELCVGIFAACIPTYVPLLRKVAEQRSLASRLIESKSRRTGGSSRTQTVKTGFSSTNHGTEMWSKAKEDRSWVSVGEDDDRLELGKHQGPSSFA